MVHDTVRLQLLYHIDLYMNLQSEGLYISM